MRLEVILPSRSELDLPVGRIVVDGPDGSFCLLPRHRDVASPIRTGLLAYTDEVGGEEHFLGIGGGLMVKQGDLVRVATAFAVQGVSLGEIRDEVRRLEGEQREKSQEAHAALGRMEANLVRRFMELRRDR